MKKIILGISFCSLSSFSGKLDQGGVKDDFVSFPVHVNFALLPNLTGKVKAEYATGLQTPHKQNPTLKTKQC